MQPFSVPDVQRELDRFVGQTVYLHVETTNGAYTEGAHGVSSIAGAKGAFIRNVPVTFLRAVASGVGPHRVGLKVEQGWIYAEGLTDWELDAEGRLLLAGHDKEGRLAVALELSFGLFPIE